MVNKYFRFTPYILSIGFTEKQQQFCLPSPADGGNLAFLIPTKVQIFLSEVSSPLLYHAYESALGKFTIP